MAVSLPITPESVSRTTLDNGLVILAKQNPNNPSVTLRGRIRTGALYDTDATSGLAHFSTSALQRGTRKRTFQELNAELDQTGMAFGVASGMESTGFSGKCLVENFDDLLDIAADVLMNPTFPLSEVEKLRSQIITDLREDDQDTSYVSYREFRKLCYPPAHPYHRLTDGTIESVERMRTSALKQYHATHYRPDTTAVVIVGDIDPADATDRVNRTLGRWQAKGLPPPYIIPDSPTAGRVLRTDTSLAGKTQTDLVLGYVGLRRTDPDYYALSVADLMLGRLGLYGRLGATVRDQQGLAYYVYSRSEASVGAGPWAVHAGVNPKNLERAIVGILAEIARFRSEPVSADELDEARDFITGSMALGLETNDGVASSLIDIEFFDLGLDYLQRYPGIIRSITAEKIESVVNKYALPDDYVVSTAGPGEPSGQPSQPVSRPLEMVG